MANDLHLNALPPGHRLHWYIIERVLGQGGFGITYLARDENLDQTVAIKEYLPSEIAVRGQDDSIQSRSADDAERYRWGKERFLAEARTLAKFNHPNIVHVFSVFEANHTAYMVMRYEEGDALRAILKQRKHLAEDELMGVVLPICDGLTKVHAAGFIHRDIQPSNIYIRSDSTPVLLDFGAARRTMGNPRTLTIMVAPGYAPIEQYYSSGAEQGPWTDIYGLGATLYRAISGAAPIDAIERSRGMLGNSRDLLVPAAMIGSGRYSDDFLRAIDHALMFNDKDRPRCVSDWIAELRGDPVPKAATIRSGTGLGKEPRPQKTSAAMPPLAAPTEPAESSRIKWALAALIPVAIAFGVWLEPSRFQAATGAAPAKTVQSKNPVVEKQAVVAGPAAVPAAPAVIGTAPAAMNAGEQSAGLNIPAAGQPVAEIAPPAIAAPATTPPATAAMNAKSESPEPDTELVQSKAELTALREQLRDESARLATLQQDVQTLRTTRAEKPAPAEPAPIKAKDTPALAPVIQVAPAPPLAIELQNGLDALAAGNFETALQRLLPLARAGNAVAQYHVALLYRKGQGVLANNATALDWMRKAAWQRHAEAQVALARLYVEGIDATRDYFLSYVWFLAAERNGVFSSVTERAEVEKRLQPEQLPQAMSLAHKLSRARPGMDP